MLKNNYIYYRVTPTFKFKQYYHKAELSIKHIILSRIYNYRYVCYFLNNKTR